MLACSAISSRPGRENTLNKTKKRPLAVALMIIWQCSLGLARIATHSSLLGNIFPPGKREHKEYTKKRPHAVALMIIWQCSIFPGRRQPSIFDDEKLNFCVRNENRWILLSIATRSGIITGLPEIIVLDF